MKYELKSTRHPKVLLQVFMPKDCLELMEEVFIDVCNKLNVELIKFDDKKNHVPLLILYHS